MKACLQAKQMLVKGLTGGRRAKHKSLFAGKTDSTELSYRWQYTQTQVRASLQAKQTVIGGGLLRVEDCLVAGFF